MRKSLATVGVLALLVGTAAACSSNEGGSADDDKFGEHTGSVGTAEQSKGPAAEVKGAEKGGKVTYMASTVFDHMDPTQTYYVATIEVGNMFNRKLTQYKIIDGQTVVVGDLATDPGKDVSDGKCTKWEFTLKDGLKYEDGSEIKAEDVGYNISRSFALTQGPQFFAEWLKGSDDYEGPFDGGEDLAPGITVDGNKITFELKSGHCDMPYMAAMSTSAPLPKDKDTDNPEDYDKHPFSSGPYKFADSWSSGKGVKLVKNDQWDPKTDPIRHQYPDEINVTFDLDLKQSSETVMAASGDDKYAYVTDLDPSVLSTVANDEEMAKRSIEEPGIFTYWMGINNERITDPDVRKALNYAINKESIVKTYGGSHVAIPGYSTLSPTVNGYKEFDFYGGSKGDKKKAKEMLKGKDVGTLTYAYRDTGSQPEIAANLKEQLKEVGIELEIEGLPQQTAPVTLGSHKDNKYDLYMKNWGADWPSGSTVLPPIYDGRTIKDAGNVNNIFYNNDDVNKRIDEINAMTDLEEANKAWGELDEQIMKEDAPMVPLFYSKHFSLNGGKVGGLYLSSVSGTVSLTDVFAKK
jgi:peptide/nickel transport system substrate-binding protein